MPKIIEVTVASDGTTTVQTKGYLGSDCLMASRFIEQALGTIGVDHKTPEFYQSVPVVQPIQQ